MEVLVPYLLCALFLLAAWGLLRLSLRISSSAARRKILSYGRASEDAMAALAASYFGSTNVLANCWIPYRTKNGTAYTEIDCIVFLRGKIAVLEVKSLVGTIRNPDTGTWHQSARMRDGTQKELDFVNPLWQNERHTAALVSLFEKERLDFPISVESLVVFTSNRAVFTYPKQEGVYSLSEAMKELHRLNNTGSAFKFGEKLKIHRTIKKYTKSKRQAMAINNKLRRR